MAPYPFLRMSATPEPFRLLPSRTSCPAGVGNDDDEVDDVVRDHFLPGLSRVLICVVRGQGITTTTLFFRPQASTSTTARRPGRVAGDGRGLVGLKHEAHEGLCAKGSASREGVTDREGRARMRHRLKSPRCSHFRFAPPDRFAGGASHPRRTSLGRRVGKKSYASCLRGSKCACPLDLQGALSARGASMASIRRSGTVQQQLAAAAACGITRRGCHRCVRDLRA